MNKADILFVNGPILLSTEPLALHEPGFLAVRDGRVAAAGRHDPAAPPDWEAGETVDLRGNLLMPGLVNAHTHAAMTLFRGLADDLPLMEWLNGYIFPVERHLSADWVYWGTKLACIEMIASGTTAFGDMYLFEEAAARAVDECGLRAVLGEVLFDFPSPNYGPPEAGLAYTRELIARWRGHERIRIAVEPHAPYTCSPALLRQSLELAREQDVSLIIHLAETRHEVEDIKARYGTTPVRHLDALGLLGPGTLGVHVIHVDTEELDRLAATGTRVAHTPESNMKLASGAAPIAAMLERQMTVGIGTDGCASNNNLDLFAEMDTASKLVKLARANPTAAPARQIVDLATRRSAAALGFETGAGTLLPGQAADLIVVDFQQPHLTPVYDYLSHLVYCAGGADVLSTMVAGRWLMRERRLPGVDVQEVRAQVNAIAAQVRRIVRG